MIEKKIKQIRCEIGHRGLGPLNESTQNIKWLSSVVLEKNVMKSWIAQVSYVDT